jgi:hypothetical protein
MRPTVNRRLSAAIRFTALAGVFAIALGACSNPASQAPSATPGSSPTPGTAVLELDRAPDNLGCDTIGVDYRSVTFHIDPSADPQIWAVTNTGGSLGVRWDSTFEAGTDADPTVVDAEGETVLSDGDTLEIPEGAFPELKGHFVCPGTTELFILDAAPAD